MTSFSISFYILLALLSISACSLSNAASHLGDEIGSHAVSVASLFPSSSCSSSTSNTAVDPKSTLPVIHRGGPCDRHSVSWEDRRVHAQLLRQDDERVTSIQSKLSGVIKGQDQSLASTDVRLPAQSGASLGVGNYVVTIGFGTPKKDVSLEFDTGSDLTWTQCKPCAGFCHNQTDPIFDPSQSSSYTNVSCTSTTCTQIASGTSLRPGCSGSTCLYGVGYGDRSFTIGFFATDKLTLSPTESIDNFQFGCGQNNRGLFGRAAGLMGLGRDRISIVEQSASKYGRCFSYCLPASSSSIGYLSFGKNEGSSATFTPLATLSNPGFYGINIVAMRVGGKRLDIPQTIFSNAGFIIDSGTVITRLPRTAYNILRNAFRQGMSNYTMAPTFSLLDSCYDFSKYDQVLIPKVAFICDSVIIDLTPNNILYIVSKAQVCLAFAGNTDDNAVGIYGNTQQKTFEVTYDVAGGRIGFAPNGC